MTSSEERKDSMDSKYDVTLVKSSSNSWKVYTALDRIFKFYANE